MSPVPFGALLGALLRLGCRIAREDERIVTVVRGAAVIQHIPRIDPVPPVLLRNVLRSFSFSDEEFIAALRRVN